jgi:hypothetical protein
MAACLVETEQERDALRTQVQGMEEEVDKHKEEAKRMWTKLQVRWSEA